MPRACVGALFALASPPFNSHKTAMCSEGPLCGRLAHLLLPLLAATASDLQLPEQQRPLGSTWGHAQQVAAAMAYLCATLGADSALAESGSLLRVLQLAAKLAILAPCSLGDELYVILHLMGVAASGWQDSIHGQHAMTAQQSAHLAQQLLSTLPTFLPPLSHGNIMRVSWRGALLALDRVLKLLKALADSSTPSLGHVWAWCMGTAAAVRLLAPLSAAGQLPDAAMAQAAAEASESVCHLGGAATNLIVKASTAASRLNCLLGTAATAAAAAAALEAAWQLHSTLCRAVHAGKGTCAMLIQAASGIILAADYLRGIADLAAPAPAMGATHFALLRAALLEPTDAAVGAFNRPEACIDAAMGLSIAARSGPAAIAAHPDTEAMFACLAAGMAEVSARCRRPVQLS